MPTDTTHVAFTVDDFISKLEQEFDDIETGKIKPNTVLNQAIDWNSINSLVVITMIEYEYDALLNIDEVDPSQTIEQIFELIKSKFKA